MIIETERLLIRPPKSGDAKPVNLAINQSLNEIGRWMPWASDPSLETTEDFIRRGIKSWQETQPKELPMIIELKSTGEIISASGFNDKSNFEVPMFETGYWINTKFSGNGYITEAVIAITRFAFDHFSAARVQICAQKENSQSINVAKRAGFIEEAILKNYRIDCLSKKPCDEVIYACFEKKMLPNLNAFRIFE
ncbi:MULTISPECIES: GNAT family N-acetyltransferase [Legionella]|uniref:Multifunctional nucleotidyltransferase/glutamate rich protein GrpB/ribosomal protein alanine acetyltransferase n=1 Tax=Legionella drozanskii LLAP-1 TaxID=1212489 RepID=A0A0W0T0Z2_9GAMM|nr:MULTISPECIES: GNAT family N-acetyltransferase [Legionella]KTC89259.1 multifunctional nucleotidyltransferase/glutamate rich protein GrpB/ribosomal protein alanine acetyltransferase [Legionella drozanskii LLAP-1]PJE13409.1 MAG: N-acetyltransferase [Legionella sp.]